MKNPPFFSVVIPTHKRATLLRRALESVKSQRCAVTFEVLVVSDASDDATDLVCREMLEATDLYVRRNGEAGPSDSRNLALDHAKGRYVLFLDDDDAWHPGMLEQLHAQPLVQQGEPVYFNCSVVQERRFPDRTETIEEAQLDLCIQLNEDVFTKNQVHMSCFAFPRHLLNGLRFDPYMRGYEDWEFLLSVFERQMPKHVPVLGSRVYEVPDATSDRRGQSDAANDFNAVLDYLYVYRRRPAPSPELKDRRAALLTLASGMNIPASML